MDNQKRRWDKENGILVHLLAATSATFAFGVGVVSPLSIATRLQAVRSSESHQVLRRLRQRILQGQERVPDPSAVVTAAALVPRRDSPTSPSFWSGPRYTRAWAHASCQCHKHRTRSRPHSCRKPQFSSTAASAVYSCHRTAAG